MASTDVDSLPKTSGSADSKTVVTELVNLSRQIKERSSELTELRKKYKELGAKVRGIMQSQDITTIQAGGSNVTLFEKKLTQSLTQDFVADSLTEFFKASDVQLQQPQKVATDAASYIFDAKKTTDRGTQWSLTVRQPKKKEAGVKKTKKRKTDEEKEESAPAKKAKAERMEF